MGSVLGGLLMLMALCAAVAVVFATFLMWIAAKMASVEKVTFSRSALAAFGSIVVTWFAAAACSIVPIVGTLMGLLLGVALSLAVIKLTFETSLGKAFLVWVFHLLAELAAVVFVVFVLAGLLGAISTSALDRFGGADESAPSPGPPHGETDVQVPAPRAGSTPPAAAPTPPGPPAPEGHRPAAMRWNDHPDGRSHWYEWIVVPGGITWGSADSRAKSLTLGSLRGHLATITSEAEHVFVVSGAPAYRTAYWVGGLRDSGARSFSWVTGEPFAFTRWDATDSMRGDGVLISFSSERAWGTAFRNTTYEGFLVEFEP